MDPARYEGERTRAVLGRLIEAVLAAIVVIALGFSLKSADDVEALGVELITIVAATVTLVARRSFAPAPSSTAASSSTPTGSSGAGPIGRRCCRRSGSSTS